MNFLRFIILPDFHGEKIPALDGGIEESFYLLIFCRYVNVIIQSFNLKLCVNYS